MPAWLFLLFCGLTDIGSTIMFLLVETAVEGATFADGPIIMGFLCGNIGTYMLARFRFYGKAYNHLQHLDVGALFPYVVLLQMSALNFFKIERTFPFIKFELNVAMTSPPHLLFFVVFVIAVFGLTFTIPQAAHEIH